jgi:cytochrome c-type biogenesis protein CcmH/NrfG
MVLVRQSHVVALGYLKKAVEIDPKIASNWAILADAYAQLGDTNEAIKAADKALKLEPENKNYQSLRKKLVASTQPSTQTPSLSDNKQLPMAR